MSVEKIETDVREREREIKKERKEEENVLLLSLFK